MVKTRVEDVVDGACDDSVRNGCTAGTPNDDAIADTSNAYLWRCDGLRGGENSDKCHKFMPVDGVCDESVRNGCTAGTANDDAIADNDTVYLWRCDGEHGGRNSSKCHIPVSDVVDGACDESVRNGCSAGTANDAAFPDSPTVYAWRCDGANGGGNSGRCSKFVPVDGVCNDSVHNGCTAGTPNDEAFADNSTGYLWRCDGLHGGRNSSKCFIRVEDVPVDGACDESVRNGCSAGTANDGAIPDSSNAYLWRCDGLHGGENSEKCLKFMAVDGVCDESVRNGCSAGTANDDAIADTSSAYLWRCDGLHGGANSERCRKFMPVDGACDESVRNGCSAGTANDDAIADTSSAYLWRCDGLHGGANSERCRKFMAVDGGWSAWSACSATACGGSGTQTRSCDSPSPEHGGQACLKLDGTRGTSETRACTGASALDGGWSAWSSCSASCGSGRQTRTCTNPAPGCGGSACSGPSLRSCTANAPVDGGWSAWSACSPGYCGARGTQTRTCNNPSPSCGGSVCAGASSRSCTGSDPIDGGWSGWSACSAACGASGTQTRTCSLPSPGCGGANCTGASSRSCTGECVPVRCTAAWSAWSPGTGTVCSGTALTQTRTRSCPAGCNSGNCAENQSQSATGTRPATDCVWGDWSEWSPWSACVNGERSRTRSREVQTPAACGGNPCPPPSTQTQTVESDCRPPCGTCSCTPSLFDGASAGVCGRNSNACIVSPANCPVCDCSCTSSTADGASAGVCSSGGAACTVSAGNCPVSCGADWPSTPTETRPGGWDCFGSGSEGGNYCPWGVDVYRRDCAAGCNDGDCSEVKAGPRKVTGRCLSNSPRCGPP